jgi:CheY-like chemotaxis protein
MTSDTNTQKTVLVINDNDLEISLFRLIFEKMPLTANVNVNLVEANGMDAALPLLDTTPPDLILLTYWLHGKVDGIQLTAILRERDDTAQVPIIFTTARSDQQTYQDAMKAGITEFITQPFNPRKFMTTVESFLS